MALVLCAPSARACDTPVYRYAMENWIPDAFPLVLIHRAPLPAPLQKQIDELNTRNENGLLNAGALALDADLTSHSQFKALLDRFGSQPLPRLALLRPQSLEPAAVLWDGAPDAATIAAILDSPARRQIVQRLSERRHAAVWVLLESGDRAADEAAARTLTEHITRAPARLREAGLLPTPENADATTQTGAAPPPQTSPTTQTTQTQEIVFSLLRVSRTDAQERFFIRMLDMVAAAARDEAGNDAPKVGAEPVAIPIFARGRALVAFAGPAISEDNIMRGCAVLAGPCACELKAQNPGIDMLFAADWSRALEGSAAAAPEIPSLGSVTPLAAAAPTSASAPGALAPRAAAPSPAPGGGQGILLASGGGALLLLLLGVGAAGWVIKARKAK